MVTSQFAEAPTATDRLISEAGGLARASGSPMTQCRLTLPSPCGVPAPCNSPCDLHLGPERHALLELGNLARLAVMALPGRRGSFLQQANELFAQVTCILRHQPTPLTPTTMMVFLRDRADEANCREMVRMWFGSAMPVTTYVAQPPCGGAALGVELWAWGGPGVTVWRVAPEVVVIEADGIRWIYCGDIRSDSASAGPYTEATRGLDQMRQELATAGVGFDQVVRTWLYVNQITAGAEGRQRYHELNRARTDFYRGIQFGGRSQVGRVAPRAPSLEIERRARSGAPYHSPQTPYPASTGIGTHGDNITMSCMALDSRRPDVFLLPLENPQQTPAYDYQSNYSPHSPKFSRAMAVVQGHFVTTLVSGTASIVHSKTVHPGDIVRQTEQTLDNIERLIAPENFARHGLPGAGATLRDIAKLRVYVKRPENHEACRAVVERRLPRAPAIYLHADICRPDLLVEIEAVAFSPFNGGVARPGINGHALSKPATAN